MESRTLGHYRLEQQIGEGGMGAVFRAFDTRLNRPVAVKMMHAPDRSERRLKGFLREARAASALNHPNIVIIHEVGETDAGEFFLVQELIDGDTLRALLKLRREPTPLDTIVDVGMQIARALSAAHLAGVVHRDVKPENVMIRTDGFVKVLDFGLARRTDDDTSEVTTQLSVNTLPGTFTGTPAYMAPEAVNGAPSGPATDIFALGVLLYEMAAGRRPFDGSSHLKVIASIINDEPVPLGRLNPAIPRMFDALVQQMLRKEQELRPSAREVEVGLAAFRAGAGEAPLASPVRRTTVGRDAQRAQLQRAYARVKQGRGLIASVTGEPGIGKTSLIEDFLRELASRGERPTIARGRCSESLAGAEAYLPILEALDGLAHRSDGPSLTSVIRAVAPTWYVQVATPSVDAVLPGEARPAPAASQERMKRELGALFHEVSRAQPVVLFIDDLHWADVSTVDILNYLAGRFADMRVLVLVSYRPSDMAIGKHPFLAIRSDLQSRGLFEEVALGFLEPDDIERYLALQFPRNAFPPDFAATIHARTEGSPLFMADLVRYLRDTGGILEEEGTWVVARAIGEAPKDLPESVRGMIARKIERVDEADRRLLLAASVEGSEFDSCILAEALGMDPAEVEERLERLEREHILVQRGEEMEFPDGALTLKYRFVHVLYQNVLYASLQPTRRAALAKAIVAALVAHYGSEAHTIAGRMAVLYETARDAASSAQYFFLAAQRAAALFGFREALSLAERGLDGLRALPEGPERVQRELGLQMIRGLAIRSVKGWAAPELESTFTRARALCQQLGDPPELFPVLWNLTFFTIIRGDLALVREQTATLMRTAEQSNQPAYLIAVHHLAGVAAEFSGEFVESTRLLDRARQLHDPAQHEAHNAMFGIDPGMVARAMSSRPLWTLGFPDRALARSAETIAIGRTQRQPVTMVFALIVAQGVRLYRGETGEAIALGDEIIGLCREYEFPQEAEWARGFQGSAMALEGRTGDGAAQLQSALAALHALRSGLTRTMFLSLHADALRRHGRPEDGLAAVAEGLAYAERTTERGFLAELHRVRGELLLLKGDDAAAEEALRAALDVARQQQARGFELRAATALARLLHAWGRTPGARAALEPVYNWFTEGHGTADLVAARTLLSEMR
jgi:predicted ATPase/DNA-binding Lrp family transcriptional regulator